MDPLTALRQAFLAGGRITRDADAYILGDRKFKATAQTAYRANRGTGDLYTLDALAILLQAQVNQKVKFSDYFKLCREHGVKNAVAVTDLKDVLAYLTGASSTSACIDATAMLAQKDASLSEPVSSVELDREAAAGPRGYDYRADEWVLSDRDTVLRNPKKDFSMAIAIVDEIWKEDSRMESRPKSKGAAGQRPAEAPAVKGAPIIIVPESLASVVTIFNAKEFLEQGYWVSSNEQRAKLKGTPDVVRIQRKSGITGNVVEYEVYHDVASFTAEMWKRVVCVIVQGQSWQFKGWAIGKTPQEIFEKVYCFHLHFDDEKAHPNIATWGIKSFSVSKTRRHLTMSVYHTMWQNIEQRIASSKSQLVHF